MPTTYFLRVLCHQIRYDRSQQVFFAQVKSSPKCYDAIYHPFPVTPKNLKMWVVDSPTLQTLSRVAWRFA